MIVGAVSALAVALVAQETRWPIGTEREVDEGVYMQVVASDHGWRIWRSETRAGVDCKAVKSARGRPHPIPIGVASMLFRGTPFLEVGWSNPSQKFSYTWRTVHLGSVRFKARVPGSRFWEEGRGYEFDPAAFGESGIEVVLTSWEYPEIYIGHAEESATFDLAGLSWAQEQVVLCAADDAGSDRDALLNRLSEFEVGSGRADAGATSDEEYGAQKQRLLGRPTSASAQEQTP